MFDAAEPLVMGIWVWAWSRYCSWSWFWSRPWDWRRRSEFPLTRFVRESILFRIPKGPGMLIESLGWRINAEEKAGTCDVVEYDPIPSQQVRLMSVQIKFTLQRITRIEVVIYHRDGNYYLHLERVMRQLTHIYKSIKDTACRPRQIWISSRSLKRRNFPYEVATRA